MVATTLAACFLGLILIFGVLGAISLALDIGRPYGGFFAYNQVFADHWTLDTATPIWWPSLASEGRGGLAYTDYLLRVNGVPYDATHGEVYAAAYARGESTFELAIERNNRVLELRLPLTPFSLPITST